MHKTKTTSWCFARKPKWTMNFLLVYAIVKFSNYIYKLNIFSRYTQQILLHYVMQYKECHKTYMDNEIFISICNP